VTFGAAARRWSGPLHLAGAGFFEGHHNFNSTGRGIDVPHHFCDKAPRDCAQAADIQRLWPP
jgi:hypothetical protein